MRWFGNDKDGFSKEDFEKLTLGILLIGCTFTLLLTYILRASIDTNLVYVIATLGSLFVVRKGLSYFKPSTYGQTFNASQVVDDINSKVSDYSSHP